MSADASFARDAAEWRAERRLFYVGLTRVHEEIHMLYCGFVSTPSDA